MDRKTRHNLRTLSEAMAQIGETFPQTETTDISEGKVISLSTHPRYAPEPVQLTLFEDQ